MIIPRKKIGEDELNIATKIDYEARVTEYPNLVNSFTIRPQPVDLAAGPLQPPDHEGLATLRQGSVDLLERIVGLLSTSISGKAISRSGVAMLHARSIKAEHQLDSWIELDL